MSKGVVTKMVFSNAHEMNQKFFDMLNGILGQRKRAELTEVNKTQGRVPIDIQDTQLTQTDEVPKNTLGISKAGLEAFDNLTQEIQGLGLEKVDDVEQSLRAGGA